MPKFVIEREIPGAGKMSPAELKTISKKSCGVLSSFPSHVMRPRGKKRPEGGTVVNFGAYADSGGGNEVGLDLVLRARSVVGPETLRAPRIVATG
jgi:hypothetical protein